MEIIDKYSKEKFKVNNNRPITRILIKLPNGKVLQIAEEMEQVVRITRLDKPLDSEQVGRGLNYIMI